MCRALAMVVALVLAAVPAVAGLPTVAYQGRPYVELPRLAAHLKGRIEPSANGLHAAVRLADRVIVFTRDRAEVLVDGRALALDAPVRVRGGVWLVPESATGRLTARSQPAAPAITLSELRWRSYPSFTRVVVETSAPLEHSVGAAAGRE